MNAFAKGRISAILLSLALIITMMPIMAVPAFADDEIPECTVTLDPGIIGGDPVIVKSTDEGMFVQHPTQPANGQFQWVKSERVMYYSYPQIPSSFAVPDNIQFAGWTSTKWSNVQNPGYFISFKNATDNQATLTAQWNAAFITFDPGEGSGTTDRELVAKDEPYMVPECDFTAPDGKVFKGWNTVAEGTSGNSGTWYYPGDTLTPGQDVTLYARWRGMELSIFPYDKTQGISDNWCGAVKIDDEDEQIGNTWWGSIIKLAGPKGRECTATVAPDNGYRFIGWYKGEYISTAGDELDARPDMDQLITTDRSYKFTVDSDLVFCPVFEEDDLINRVSIVDVSTDPDSINTHPFTGKVDPRELSPTGEYLSSYIELTEKWTSTDGQDVLSSEDATCIPVVGKTYRYSVTITAKGDNVFDTENGFLFFCNGTEYDYADLNVTFSNDKKTATISGFIPDQTAKAVDLKDAEISGLAAKTYNGKAQTQDMVVKMDVNGTQVTLENGIDYDVSYSNNVNAGTATMTITGKGSYTGTISREFKISPASIAKATVTGISTKVYTGKALTQTPVVKLGSVTLKSGTNYTLSYKNNTNAGTATVTITGKGNYTGTVSREFKISPASIAKATVTGIKTKVYTGKALTQAPVVKLGGVTLKSGTNYTLSYKNNVNAGTATMTITGKGNYSGAITKTFTINKAANLLTIKAKTATVMYSALKKKAQTLAVGKVITFSRKGQGTMTYVKISGNKMITINKKNGNVTVGKNLKKGTYSVKVKAKAGGTANYKPSAWKVVTFRIVVK